MAIDPLTLTTVPADEQWDETLDALAQVVVREMAERGVLDERTESPARFHVRSFGRRLLNPLLDEVRLEIQAAHREVAEVGRENGRLRARFAAMQRARRHRFRLGIVVGVLWTLLVLGLGWIVLSAGRPAVNALHSSHSAASAPAPNAPPTEAADVAAGAPATLPPVAF